MLTWPLSSIGTICPSDIHNDPPRFRYPMRRSYEYPARKDLSSDTCRPCYTICCSQKTLIFHLPITGLNEIWEWPRWNKKYLAASLRLVRFKWRWLTNWTLYWARSYLMTWVLYLDKDICHYRRYSFLRQNQSTTTHSHRYWYRHNISTQK